MKVIFMGTPDFAKESLEAIYNAGHEILAVVTNIDKPKGRGMKMIYTPVKEFALEKGLSVFQPTKVRNNEEFINEMNNLKPDVLCVVAYGKILPKEMLDVPKYGSINVHGSLLPKYRGAAPIQWAVINGEKETGITTMFMDEGMDTGDMILKEKVQIGDEETTGELWERLSEIGAKLLTLTLKKIEEAKINIKSNNSEQIKNEIKELLGVTKQGEDFTLAPMLNKEMANIDWNKSASEINNLIRGLNPIMGTFTFYKGKKIKIWKAKALNENDYMVKNNIIDLKNYQNGQIINSDKKKGLFIKTQQGILSVLEIQAENSKKMDIKSFLNGTELIEDEILSVK